ncbi:hypothetical protein [Niveibacterium sp.]|uniref:hypothetical protein n=1 Tax=Niveibacterium sp. TaxID=2017444 RepID=UPI0035AFFA57
MQEHIRNLLICIALALVAQPVFAGEAPARAPSACDGPVVCAGDQEQIRHPRSGKLILLHSGTLFIQYHYDPQGLLEIAEASDGRAVRLAYDTRGRVIHMWATTDAAQAKRELRFAYGDTERPIRIELLGTGVITVRYDADGEIAAVHSPSGAATALGVTQAFQALMALVKPPCPPL